MSKFVKDLLTRDLRNQLSGVSDALLVNVIGLDAIRTTKLRGELRKKNIKLEVIKNSMAKRATEGTPLAPAFEGVEGTLAIVWGADDFVSLTKEIVKFSEAKEFEGFATRSGTMDGAKLTPAEIKDVSKWPSRQEQLSILVSQILGPGARLASQLTSVGGEIASQLKVHAENLEKAGGGSPTPSGEPAPTA
ncbi:MAG TPA: 50S ribosomal protein L10 [Pirellulales bacterium]|jgi:ribosomal protein L10|nr:50S ribosomal protein L10 [Pirellulales bacterium]